MSFAVVFAMAQNTAIVTENGDANTAYVNQQGVTNTATIIQIGDKNGAAVADHFASSLYPVLTGTKGFKDVENNTGSIPDKHLQVQFQQVGSRNGK